MLICDTPRYEAKDPLHGLAHAFRILDAARAIARSERLTDLDEILIYGALFHGLAAQALDRVHAYFVGLQAFGNGLELVDQDGTQYLWVRQ